VFFELLPEPEYSSEVAAAMAEDFLPKARYSFTRTFRSDSIWAAREDRPTPREDDQRRTQFALALKTKIEQMQEPNENKRPAYNLTQLAKALAAIDGLASEATVLSVIARASQWDQFTCVEAVEYLLMAGAALPVSSAIQLVECILDRTQRGMTDSDKHLLCRTLALLPFVDCPAEGIAKIREVLRNREFHGYELREIVSALGESRSDDAVDLVCELALKETTFMQCEESFVRAFATLDAPRTSALLLSFVDPDVPGIALGCSLHREDVLVASLAEIARRSPKTVIRLRDLCSCDLPDLNRHLLSKVMGSLGTPEALAALNLIDDDRPTPIPKGIRDLLEGAFVERRPSGRQPNIFTVHACASNQLRRQLFRMAIEDNKRHKSASLLLGQMEEWRLELGRPWGEPRHPDLASGHSWPPDEHILFTNEDSLPGRRHKLTDADIEE
jgi:hypothetical protein